MAAVIDFRTGSAVPQHTAPAPRRPALTVIEGGRSDSARSMRRVYLLRRALVAAALLAVVLLAAQAVGAVLSGAGAASPVDATTVHRVERGDTLWAVASAAEPAADPRDVIDRIVELNGGRAEFSPDAPLRPGQELVVPAAGG